jgi:outer membrane protein OmpA-like peptidoglycan-associated protein
MRDETGATWRRGGLAVAIAALLATGGCHSLSGSTSKTSLIQAPASCADMTASIYFEAYSAAITHEAGQLINAVSQQAHDCRVSGITIIGLADAPGSPDANLELSKRRAEAVTRVHHHGFSALDFQVAAVGEAGAQSPQGQARPLRRRADVTFHLAPK